MRGSFCTLRAPPPRGSGWAKPEGFGERSEKIKRAKPERKEVMYMAKITIAGDAVVVTSSMKLEDLKTIEKYRRNELILRGGEDGKEPIFAVCTTSGTGDINANGASFGSAARDGSGLACITMSVGGDPADVTEYVADKYGAAVIKLNKLEENLPAVLAEIAAEKATVMENITIAQ